MDASTTTIIVSVVAMLIAGVAMWKAHKSGAPITGQLITSTLQESQATATELTDVALTAVQASEQLWRTGKIGKSERLDKAFAYVKRWYPQLDQATIITALESAVLIVNSVVASLPNAKPVPPLPTPKPTVGLTGLS